VPAFILLLNQLFNQSQQLSIIFSHLFVPCFPIFFVKFIDLSADKYIQLSSGHNYGPIIQKCNWDTELARSESFFISTNAACHFLPYNKLLKKVHVQVRNLALGPSLSQPANFALNLELDQYAKFVDCICLVCQNI
jgi:hypothetical protein